jgi:aminopeptidase N
MSSRVRAFFFVPLLAFCGGAFAQPYQYGCHYFRHHPAHPPTTTAQDRALIDDIIARSDTFDILDYDIALDVTDYSNQWLKAATTITCTPLMAGQDFIRFELWNLPVDSVVSPAGPLTFTQDTMHLRVDFATPPAIGDTARFTVYYHGHPHRDADWGGFYFESGYIYNLGIGLTTIPPNFGKVWYPCFDSFVERATYTYHVKSAGTFRAHCQGDFLGEVQLGGDTVIRSFRMAQRIPTHLSAIAAADYQDTDFVHAGANGDIPVRLTAKPAQLAAMTAKFADIGAAIDACEYWYGPYAWQRVGYVLTTDGALEIPTNIAYPDFMTSQSLFENRGLFTHELGHHWWGDMVTPRTQQDMWLKEGPAEYSGHLVEEWLGGQPAFEDVVKNNQKYVLSQANVQDGGFQPLSPMPDPYIYGLTTYYKGASVMHNLRGYLGDSLFRVGMHDVQVAHAYSTLDAAGFRNALETATGYDLHPFFTDQVFAPGFSVFVVQSMNAQQNGGAWDVDLQIKQKLRGTAVFHQSVPLDITLVGADGQRQEYRQMVGGEFTNLTLACGFQPVMAVLNGHNRLNQARLDLERNLVPGQSFNAFLPYVDFRLFADQLPDTALIRIEHIWAGPDPGPLGFGIDQISSTHYWTVDGLWPAGTALHAKVDYSGLAETALDHDLFGTTELGALLVYRPDAQSTWQIYPDQTLHANSLTNGVGTIDINVLLKGQYAFAKGPGSVAVAETPGTSGQLRAWPVPATDRLHVGGLPADAGSLLFTVYGMDGSAVLQGYRSKPANGELSLEVSGLAPGPYVLQLRTTDGAWSGRKGVVIAGK